MFDANLLQNQLNEAQDSLKIRLEGFPTPLYALVLGTGLGDIVSSITVHTSIPYGEIPHFPISTAPSHAGRLIFGYWNQIPVVVMQGRIHGYEGLQVHELAFPIRLLKLLGAHTLVITNAAGGLSMQHRCSDIMLITDHINLMGKNPLTGPNLDQIGDRFPDMSQVYDPNLIRLAEQAALEIKISVHKGVYAGVPGPSMETPAETRMLRILGADAVGMSTVPEVIAAVHCGFRILGISAITNVNRPDCMEPAPIETILANAKSAGNKIHAMLTSLFQLLP